MKPLCDQMLARFKGRSRREPGEIGQVLGMEIMRDRPSQTMTISHRMKIKDLLDSNGMKGCRTSPTPLVPKEIFEEPEARPFSSTKKYLRAPYLHKSCKKHPVHRMCDAAKLGFCCTFPGQA